MGADDRSYYVNILTGEKTWARPAGFDNMASRRGPSGVPVANGGIGSGLSNVYVGGLPAGMNDMSFRQLFGCHGNIISVKVVSELCYGFVKFSNYIEAQQCIDAMN